MKKTEKIILFIYLVAYIFPVLGMINCSGGLTEIIGSGQADSCIIHVDILHSYALLYWGLLYFGSFFLALPIIAYFLIINLVINKIYTKNPDLEKKGMIKFIIGIFLRKGK